MFSLAISHCKPFLSFIFFHSTPLSRSKASSPKHNNHHTDDLEECLVCSNNERCVIYSPCNHVVTCDGCAQRVKKCLLCRQNVESWTTVPKTFFMD